jgi:hypothetical protein|tara:strand:- start:668 stop:835 length:168 start_codon:yes stop_codon:yes gene_type:complete
MPYGKGTYGSQKGRPPKKKPAKKLSTKQKTIARMGGSPNKIDASDLKMLRAKRKK